MRLINIGDVAEKINEIENETIFNLFKEKTGIFIWHCSRFGFSITRESQSSKDADRLSSVSAATLPAELLPSPQE